MFKIMLGCFISLSLITYRWLVGLFPFIKIIHLNNKRVMAFPSWRDRRSNWTGCEEGEGEVEGGGGCWIKNGRTRRQVNGAFISTLNVDDLFSVVGPVFAQSKEKASQASPQKCAPRD